jgi:hypothetical protein
VFQKSRNILIIKITDGKQKFFFFNHTNRRELVRYTAVIIPNNYTLCIILHDAMRTAVCTLYYSVGIFDYIKVSQCTAGNRTEVESTELLYIIYTYIKVLNTGQQ